jgi:hypothetical protein
VSKIVYFYFDVYASQIQSIPDPNTGVVTTLYDKKIATSRMDVVFGNECCKNDLSTKTIYQSIVNYPNNRTINHYAGAPKLEIVRTSDPNIETID